MNAAGPLVRPLLALAESKTEGSAETTFLVSAGPPAMQAARRPTYPGVRTKAGYFRRCAVGVRETWSEIHEEHRPTCSIAEQLRDKPEDTKSFTLALSPNFFLWLALLTASPVHKPAPV